MAKWEFAIRAYDQEDLESGHKRSKKGDIIAYKPYPHEWGRKEKQGFVFVTMDGLTEEEASALCSPYYEDGKTPTVDETPTILAKRRFKIPIEELEKVAKIRVDAREMEDPNKEYQPFIDKSFDFTKDDIIYDKEKKRLSKEIIKIDGNK